ncbi:hypothetical protein VTJ83DRAFT_258 [Remersonia thermophila]|uniref:SWIM-type domain-containing protein n=1 Tax=Remersonia thermophila TaxID=72144 RepID=A0ABR4DM83_9PEZI
MCLSPTIKMSRLSLNCTSTRPSDRPPRASRRTSPAMPEPGTRPEPPAEPSDWEVDEEDDDDDTEESDIVTSPAGLRYNLSRLSPRTRQVAKGLFNQRSPHDQPQISLELCAIREDEAGGDVFYAFQMHEVVPCSVRIGARDSGRFSTPRCECPDARYRRLRPCKHLIWLFDKISKHALFDHDPDAELTLTELGYPEELGDPFDRISQIRLDVLADDLHCDTSEPDSDTVCPSPARVREAREMVAAVAGIQPHEVDGYRRDLEASHDQGPLIRRGDLGATLFSLLLASHSLAEWVRSELSPSDPAVDPFRSAQHRVFRIIEELKTYSASEQDPSASDSYRRRGKHAEGPRDLNWAAEQIRRCVGSIDKLVSRGSSPLSESARSSAARALVVILKMVTDHRGLYQRLVGDHDTGFVFSTLDILADQSQYVDALDDIMDKMGVYGAPPSYVANMRSLVARMRSHKPADGVAAAAVATGSGAERRGNTPLPPDLAVQSPAPADRSPSAQAVVPGVPAGPATRGSQARRGRARTSKWSSPQDSARGSRKRLRRG